MADKFKRTSLELRSVRARKILSETVDFFFWERETPKTPQFCSCRWVAERNIHLRLLVGLLRKLAIYAQCFVLLVTWDFPPFRENESAKATISSTKIQTLTLCKKKILHHIKLTVHVWSTKCWRNKKLIAQFGCALRDEHFKPNYWTIIIKYKRNATMRYRNQPWIGRRKFAAQG